MKLIHYIWLLPFFSFLIGYQFLSYLYRIDTIATPSVVGMSLQNAFPLLSDHNLNPRLLAVKEDPDLPTGTILSQTPLAHTQIKQNQAVYLVLSHQPPKIPAPALINQSERDITQTLKPHGIHNKLYTLKTSSYPSGRCIGQFPPAGTLLDEKKIITYMASDEQKPILLPNFKEKSAIEVTEFLDARSIAYTLTHHKSPAPGHACTETCIIHDQRPLAYSIVSHSEKNPLHVQLQIR